MPYYERGNTFTDYLAAVSPDPGLTRVLLSDVSASLEEVLMSIGGREPAHVESSLRTWFESGVPYSEYFSYLCIPSIKTYVEKHYEKDDTHPPFSLACGSCGNNSYETGVEGTSVTYVRHGTPGAGFFSREAGYFKNANLGVVPPFTCEHCGLERERLPLGTHLL